MRTTHIPNGATLRSMILALVLGLCWAPAPCVAKPRYEKPGDVNKLTQKELQDWVSSVITMDLLEARDLKTKVGKEIILNTTEITYKPAEGGAEPQELVWKVQQKAGADVANAQKLVKEFFVNAVSQYEIGGETLVGTIPLKKLQDLLVVKVVAPPEGPGEPPPPTHPELKAEVDRLRTEIEALRQEIARLREAVRTSPGRQDGSDSGWERVVQPSSMLYYDCRSGCWIRPVTVGYKRLRQSFSGKSGGSTRPGNNGATGGSGGNGVEVLPPPTTDGPELSPVPGQQGAAGNPQEEAHAVTLTPPEPAKAQPLFWIGYRHYWRGEYREALNAFVQSIHHQKQDARPWYYKALTQRALGQAKQAELSAKQARALQRERMEQAEVIGKALERVQGPDRRFLKVVEGVSARASLGR